MPADLDATAVQSQLTASIDSGMLAADVVSSLQAIPGISGVTTGPLSVSNVASGSSSTGQEPVFLWLENPWTVHGRTFYELSMGSPWTVFGLSMHCPWTVHGLSMDCLWTVHGQSMLQHFATICNYFATTCNSSATLCNSFATICN